MALTLGRYELVKPLAQGGMAEVFLARRRTSGGVDKRLVIKRIRRERLRDPRFVNLFVQEARLSMALAHKNIVPVFDFGRVGDELFLAMEFVDGPDLGRVLAQARRLDQRLDPMLVAYIALEACQALDYAHSARGHDERALVHRDVTPRNVLISRAGEVKLVDFGVATSEAELESGSVRGTPAYMSPEQARGEPVDGRSDVFSLGLIMWEALAGQRAYQGSDNHTLLARARAAHVPALPDDVPAPLARIVARATADDRDQRYASSRDMQLALDEYLVAARAAAGGAPPSHVLAEWLQTHAIDVSTTGEWTAQAPAGRVVTFLDDGQDDVMRGLEGESSTLRSIAETVAEDEPDAASDPDDPGPEPDVASDPDAGSTTQGSAGGASRLLDSAAPAAQENLVPGRKRSPWLAAALAVIMAGVVVAVVLRNQGTGPSTTGSSIASTSPDASATSPDASATASGPLSTASGPSSTTSGASATTSDASSTASGPSSTTSGASATASGSSPTSPDTSSTGPDSSSTNHKRSARDHGTHAGQPTRRINPVHKSIKTPVPAATGTVKISATPWARVTVAGSTAQCTETPCTLTLPAGTHVLRLENPVAGLHKERTVQVTAGNTLVIRETLTR